MGAIKTLHNLNELGDSEFNMAPPRHGLCLLYWFACENKNGRLDPTSTAYGFHYFSNMNNGVKLLPVRNLLYYEVGNLNFEGAAALPSYVRPRERHYYGEHNKDRIIVRVNNGRIDQVYVTEHDNGNNFNPQHTYLLDQNLLDQISNLTKHQFMFHMKQQQQYQIVQHGLHIDQPHQPENDSFWSRCTIL